MPRFRWVASLAAVALVVYAATLWHRLVWDDVNLRALVVRLMHEGGPLRLVTSGFALHPDASPVYYRPVVLLSLALDTLLSNGYGLVFHLTNVALHVGCTLLVFHLARALGAGARPAWAGALLFAVHPVHVEAVAFVSGRTDLWAAFFALASALSWVRVSSGVSKRPALERSWSVAAYALAVLSKEIAFALPLGLIAWDALGVARPVGAAAAQRSWLRRVAPWIAGWSMALALAFALRAGVAGVPLSGTALVRSVENRNWNLGEIPSIVATCFRLLVFPWPLNAYYTPDQVRLGPVTVLASLLLLAAVVATSSRSMRRAGLVAIAWMVAFLLPALGIVPFPGAVVAERSLYVASVGVSLLIALAWRDQESAAVVRATPAWSRGLVPVVASVAALMAIGTVARAWVWKNELTLFADIARTSPGYSGALVNLAAAHANQGHFQEAIALSERAVRLRPGSAFAHFNLGAQLARGGKDARALTSFRRALGLRPNFPEALEKSGVALMRLERPAEAESVLHRLLRVDSTRAEPWKDLGMALRDLGRPAEAADAFRTARRLAGE